jgi:3-methyl-2-oxobutanoate hydroxymethyltransferase
MAKVTLLDLARKKAERQPIVVVTAYDWASARLVDKAGVDVILVGDSLGMVVQGHDTTLPVTLDQMIYHAACVTRAKPRAHVVVDLPFGTFQLGRGEALRASVRTMQETGAEAVKIEGAGPRLACVEAVASADIPVWGHLGLTPQSVHAMGGFRVQGKDAQGAQALLADARRIESAGARVLVLEGIPWRLAKEITANVGIPTIGIGAGPHCDGQVLVFHDLLGVFDDFVPRFVKQFAHLGAAVEDAVRVYAEEVRARRFPTLEHSYGDSPRKVESTEET